MALLLLCLLVIGQSKRLCSHHEHCYGMVTGNCEPNRTIILTCILFVQFTVTCFQMAVALVWLAVLSIFQRLGPSSGVNMLGLSGKHLSWNPVGMSRAVICAGAFTGMLATGNLCLMFVQVSFYQVADPPWSKSDMRFA